MEVRAQRDGSGNCSLHNVNIVPQRQQDERCTLPCTTACSPYTMTLPGADTMNGGIIGDDCFLFKRGLGDVEGAGEDIWEVNCARRGSAGEVSEAEEECDTERCWCVSVTADPNQLQLPESKYLCNWCFHSRGEAKLALRALPFTAMPAC